MTEGDPIEAIEEELVIEAGVGVGRGIVRWVRKTFTAVDHLVGGCGMRRRRSPEHTKCETAER
jgi:hypothetical protein